MSKPFSTPGPRANWPTAATSATLARCSLGAQLLFDRIVAAADDQGRELADLGILKAATMPYIKEATPEQLRAWLDELVGVGLIAVYVDADGTPLLQLLSWWKFQSGMRRAYASRWVGPMGWPADRIYGIGSGTGKGNGNGNGNGNGSGKGGANVPPHMCGETQPVGPGADPLIAYRAATGNTPTGRVRAWIEELVGAYGGAAVVQALAVEEASDSNRKTLLGRVQERLAAQALQVERDRKEAGAKRRADDQAAIEAMPPEQRAANLARLHDEMKKNGIPLRGEAAVTEENDI